MDLRWKTTNALSVLFSNGRTVKIHTTEPQFPHQVTVLFGLTKTTRFTRALLNTGTEWNGTERNIPEHGGMKRNGQEWYRNIPERAGMTPQRREKTLV